MEISRAGTPLQLLEKSLGLGATGADQCVPETLLGDPLEAYRIDMRTNFGQYPAANSAEFLARRAAAREDVRNTALDPAFRIEGLTVEEFMESWVQRH